MDKEMIYECSECGNEEETREDIREHIVENHDYWKNGRGKPSFSPVPLSNRHESRPKGDV